MIQGKRILLGISGGIAAYKAAALCSRLVQSGAEVKVIMTEGATKFITPLTLQTISRHRVITDVFAEEDPSVVSHIDLADHSDAVVIAPATANMIAKMAYGIADDMLSTTLLATNAPIIVAPAMNVHMYAHPAVQDNLAKLQSRGVQVIEPGTGQLACGYVGKGRLAEPETIYEQLVQLLADRQPLLAGRRLLVTAGGTIERIDPVRYLTNDSSGKMGYAIAEAARNMGAEVTLIAANTQLPDPQGVEVIPVISAQHMYDQVLARLPQMDVIIKAAAVSDYRPVQMATQKLKKGSSSLTITLEKTPDILEEIGRRKTTQYVVGFAAETEHLAQHAMAKLQAKRSDLIVANDVSVPGVGFGSDSNAVTIFDQNGEVERLPVQMKAGIANRLLTIIAERLAERGS